MKKFIVTACSIVTLGIVCAEEGWRVRVNDLEEMARNRNGEFEQIKHQISKLQKQNAKLEERLNALEQKLVEEESINDWEGLTSIVEQKIKKSEYEGAIKLISGFIENNENDPHISDAYDKLGDLYSQTKKYDEASIAYKEAYKKYSVLKKNEKSADVLSKMGMSRLMLKDIKNAKIIQ